MAVPMVPIICGLTGFPGSYITEQFPRGFMFAIVAISHFVSIRLIFSWAATWTT